MQVTIKINGHHYFSEISGEVLLWCQTVERFDRKMLQVPAVIIKNEKEIAVIALKQYLKTVDIDYRKT